MKPSNLPPRVTTDIRSNDVEYSASDVSYSSSDVTYGATSIDSSPQHILIESFKPVTIVHFYKGNNAEVR